MLDLQTPLTTRLQIHRRYLVTSITDCDKVMADYGTSEPLRRFRNGLRLILEFFDEILPEGKEDYNEIGESDHILE